MVLSLVVTRSVIMVLSQTLAHSGWVGSLFCFDSFVGYGSLMERDSFVAYGSLQFFDSFILIGSLGCNDSFVKYGTLTNNDSFSSNGSLTDCDSKSFVHHHFYFFTPRFPRMSDRVSS